MSWKRTTPAKPIASRPEYAPFPFTGTEIMTMIKVCAEANADEFVDVDVKALILRCKAAVRAGKVHVTVMWD